MTVHPDMIVAIHINNFLLTMTSVLIAAALVVCFRFFRGKSIEIDISEVNIGVTKFSVKKGSEVQQVAYRVWVEMCTRKVALPFHEADDTIVEVYNSWYEFFKITREELKKIPASKLNENGTRELSSAMVEVLNLILRPHLTKWQASFRRWYEAECAKETSKGLPPQAIQQGYPNYVELVDDITKISERLIKYKEAIEKVAFAK